MLATLFSLLSLALLPAPAQAACVTYKVYCGDPGAEKYYGCVDSCGGGGQAAPESVEYRPEQVSERACGALHLAKPGTVAVGDLHLGGGPWSCLRTSPPPDPKPEPARLGRLGS